MMGHYLRVQEAASLLGVAPTTIRWYCAQGLLPMFWIGRGQTGHRRFLYSDVEALGKHQGRSLPPEKTWDRDSIWNLKAIAEYLGLSDKFLIGTGLVASGAEMAWGDLQQLEREIYDNKANETDEENGDDMVNESMMENPMFNKGHGNRDHVHGHHPHKGGHWMGAHNFAPWTSRMRWQPSTMDPTDLLALKSAKRHLEAQKADLEDLITELTRKIESHPDCEG